MNIKLSIIIAVYKREDELQNLLRSLAGQTKRDFEIIIVDDGSPAPLESIISEYNNMLDIKYFYKNNSGPGDSRNFGMSKATGNYYLFLDSDCIAPAKYIENVQNELNKEYVDYFGGPDAAHENFTDFQKAVNFSMTSFLTTGGIRGSKTVKNYQPRSFNMGLSNKAYEATGGFSPMRIGEDTDLSLRLRALGFQSRFFPEAKVYHQRRTSLRKFAKQVFQFGVARPILDQRNPEYRKLVFVFPTLFLLGIIVVLALIPFNRFFPFNILPFYFLIFYCTLLFVFALKKEKKISVATLSIATSFTQLLSYGWGYLLSFIQLNILKRDAKKTFPSHFK